MTIRPKSQQNPLCKPQRLSGLSLGIAAALMSLAGASQAAEINLENGWSGSLNTTISVGTSIRAQDPDSELYSRAAGSRVLGKTDGTGGSNTDSGNLNYGKGDAFSTLFKVTSDLSLSKGEAGIFARVKAWYDHALEKGNVRAGNLASNYVKNQPLSDSGFEPLQKFSGIALLDAYAYNTYDIDGKPLQVRLGNQVLNWGESLFVQGINVVNPIDLSALRKPGAEIKDAFLPIPSLSMNLGLGGGRSLEAFYQFAFTPSNIDSCGTYFGVVETKLSDDPSGLCGRMLTSSGSFGDNAQAFALGGYIPMSKGDKNDDGQFGLNLRFPVESIDAELGVYYANIHSRTPLVSGRTGSVASAAPSPLPGTLNALPIHSVLGLTPFTGYWSYPEDMEIFGLSVATNVAGWSVGGELSVIPDYPAQVNANDLLNGALAGFGPMGVIAATATVPALGGGVGRDVQGYRKIQKSQLQINGIKVLPRMLGSSQSVFVGEVAFQQADVGNTFTGLRYGRAFIFGAAAHEDNTGNLCLNVSSVNPNVDGCKNDGFVTKNSWGYRLRLGLEYPGFMGTSATFYPTLSFSHDVKGYSVDNQFIEDRQTLGLSGRWNINKVHNVEVSYVRYGDQAKYDPFRDRDFYSLVLSTSF